MLANKRLIPHPDSAITNLFEMSVLYINRTALTTTPNIFSLCKDPEGLKTNKQQQKPTDMAYFLLRVITFQL